MLEKIKNLDWKQIAQNLNDLRILGLVIFGIITLLVTWSGIKTIQTNFGLQREIAKIQNQNKVLELESENMRLKNEYYTTDQYAELVAREQLGKAAKGETVLLISRSVALANAPELPSLEETKDVINDDKPFYKENFDAWMDFFFSRNEVD